VVSAPVAAEPLVVGRLASSELRAARDGGGPSSMKDKHDKCFHFATGEPLLQASAAPHMRSLASGDRSAKRSGVIACALPGSAIQSE